MKATKMMLLVFFAGFSTIEFSSVLAAANPDIKQLERLSIKYRLEHTKHGFVRMRVSNEINPAQQSEFLYELRFDERRFQQLRKCRLIGSPNWGKPEKIVLTPDACIHDVEYVETPVQIAASKDYKNSREHFGVMNPRILGMVRNGADLLHVLDIEDLLNRSNSDTTLASDEIEGATAWRINYPGAKDGGSDVSIWIIPDQGFGVARIKVDFVQNGKHFIQTTDTRMKQYAENGVWYPEHLVRTDTNDGAIVSRQVIHVEDARFDDSIDESTFTLRGLNLESGRQIVDSTSGLPWGKVWNGKEALDPSDVPSVPVNPDRRRWLLWILALALALLAGFYLRRIIQHRKSSSNSGV